MGVCNVLLTVCEAAFENLFSGLKSNRWVGDFQVATGGGFWVATRGFNDKRDLWSIDFPFAAVILGKISKSIPNQAKGAERVAAINRAMLADALEKSGDTKAANYEYAKAANIIGLGNDIQKLKKIVQTIMSHDEAFLEMENQYTYTETK
jgi:hypothetical protein